MLEGLASASVSLGLRAPGSVSSQHPGVSQVGCPWLTLWKSRAIFRQPAPGPWRKDGIAQHGVGKTWVPVPRWRWLAVCPRASCFASLCPRLLAGNTDVSFPRWLEARENITSCDA